jgi:putative DNA primase/helicase
MRPTDYDDFRADMEANGLPAGLPEPLVLDPADPLPSAVRFVEEHHQVPEGRTLHRHRGSFWAYARTHYQELPTEALRAGIYTFLAEAKRETAEGKLAPFKPTTNKVSQVIDALTAHAYLDDGKAMPSWLDDREHPPPMEVVPMANGLLHLPSGEMLPHSPKFFASNALTFAYDPTAPAPEQWLAFLAKLWPDDIEAHNALQEMMGLLLTLDTRHQKLFLIVGPKRSGKGTIGRVIRALLGAANVAGPTLSSLATNFGLQPLIGRPVAIISDARLSGRADAQVIAERLLSVSGEDAITIDRKHIDPWTGTLPTRFVILTNELPRIADASGALASRFIVLVMKESFYGREDHGLTDRLLGELPGIFNWAVGGWKRLAERGHFLMPASSAEAVADIESLSSPILAFLHATCVIEPGASVPCQELFDRWRGWCEAQGRDHPGTTQSFGRDLRAAVPGLGLKHMGGDGARVRVYAGLRLAHARTHTHAYSALHIAREESEEESRACNGVVRVRARAWPNGGVDETIIEEVL